MKTSSRSVTSECLVQWEREVIIIRLVFLQCNKTEIEWSFLLIRAKKKIYGKSKWKLIVKTSKLPEAWENASESLMLLILYMYLVGWEGSASFSYSINVEKEKPKQRRITFKALFDWRSLNQNQSNCNSLSEERKISWRTKRTKSKPPKARENAGGQVALVLIFHLIGLESGANFVDQSQSKVKQKQCSPALLLIINRKLLHTKVS